MTPATRNLVIELTGALIAVAIALGGTFAATSFYGRMGVVAVAWAVPVGVLTGLATIKLLHFAHRILSDQE